MNKNNPNAFSIKYLLPIIYFYFIKLVLNSLVIQLLSSLLEPRNLKSKGKIEKRRRLIGTYLLDFFLCFRFSFFSLVSFPPSLILQWSLLETSLLIFSTVQLNNQNYFLFWSFFFNLGIKGKLKFQTNRRNRTRFSFFLRRLFLFRFTLFCTSGKNKHINQSIESNQNQSINPAYSDAIHGCIRLLHAHVHAHLLLLMMMAAVIQELLLMNLLLDSLILLLLLLHPYHVIPHLRPNHLLHHRH